MLILYRFFKRLQHDNSENIIMICVVANNPYFDRIISMYWYNIHKEDTLRVEVLGVTAQSEIFVGVIDEM